MYSKKHLSRASTKQVVCVQQIVFSKQNQAKPQQKDRANDWDSFARSYLHMIVPPSIIEQADLQKGVLQSIQAIIGACPWIIFID